MKTGPAELSNNVRFFILFCSFSAHKEHETEYLIFDVTTIDPETIEITIEGLEVGVPPLRWHYEDAATPFMGKPGGGHALEGDGYLDLVLHFSTQEVVNTLGLCEFEDGETVPLKIVGRLYNEVTPTPEQWDTFHSMGDVNRDGYTNETDLVRIEYMFGWSGSPGGIPEDINSDGKVDVEDIFTCALNQGLNIWTYFGLVGLQFKAKTTY